MVCPGGGAEHGAIADEPECRMNPMPATTDLTLAPAWTLAPMPGEAMPQTPAPARRDHLPGAALPAQDEEVDEPLGCGWFDSSFELSQGLRVTEHASFERVQFDVPLAWLLQ
jgi:hypothetical protein